LYDLILEQIAPLMDMWSWESSVVPFNNYAAWWVIGLLFACGIRLSGTETKNPLAMILFISQFMFFVVLFFAFNLFR
jgi:bisanhydrobacterioruberin hydratase